jgi:tetratricopeptide (TPR) repeat protein
MLSDTALNQQDAANSAESDKKYTHLLYRFRLPYRIFLDDGVYFVASSGVMWRLSLKTLPVTRIEYTSPAIDFGTRSQLRLDNHGFSGVTEVIAGCPLGPSATGSEIWSRQTSDKRIRLADALKPINKLIGLYRAKTGEFWFRPIGVKDIPAFTIWTLPENSTQLEWYLTETNAEVAVGYPYLKRESWYRDLLDRAQREDVIPFALELILEGQDALARDNLRLAATNFAISMEALFRGLLKEFFPRVDTAAQDVHSMLGAYFRRYKDIADPNTLPMKKREALRLLEEVWEPRDLLAHGHELDLKGQDVARAAKASLRLFALWQKRPNSVDLGIEGPFVDFESGTFPSRDADEWVERGKERLKGGHRFDAEEAARFALVCDPKNVNALVLLGVVAFETKRYEEALKYWEEAQKLDANRPLLAVQIAQLREALSRHQAAKPPPPHLDLRNSVYMLLADNVNCARNWGFYLFNDEFVNENELRNRIATIWLHSLLDSLEAQQQKLPEYERRATELGLKSVLEGCSKIRPFLGIVAATLSLYSKEEQLFLFDYYKQLTSGFADRNAERLIVRYALGQQIFTDSVDSKVYHELIRPFYEQGNLDDTVKALTDRARNGSLGYWRIINALTQSELDSIYQAILEDRPFVIPLIG